MQYPIVREYKPDITMSLKENEIDDELKKIPKRDFIYAIVPKYAPLFLDSLVLKLPNGQELINDVHYQIPGVMGNLTRLCGRSVISIIEIIDTSIEEVLISYHTMGHFNVLDESMYSLMESAINDSRPIEWDNVTDKPIVFAPELHSHSLIYDFHSFQGLIDMIDNIMRVVEFGRVDPVVIRAKHFFETMNKYIDIYDRQIKDSLARHIGSYDAHGITKEQVNLGHLDNIATATDVEARALKDNLRMTVRQLGLIIKQFTYKKEEYLPDGLIPFSQYGGEAYLPSYKLGNYAHLDVTWGVNLWLHEEDSSSTGYNSVTGLCVGYSEDGFGDGLFYITAYGNFYHGVFPGHKYIHPFFTERNITLYDLVYLDNEFIIVRGDDLSVPFIRGGVFISRTNGTLNPAKHIYSEIIENELTFADSICATQIGDDIVLSAGRGLSRVLFSFKADMLGKAVIKPSPYEITYTPIDSSDSTTSHIFRPIIEEYYPNSALKSYGFNFAEETDIAIPNPVDSYVFRSLEHPDPSKRYLYISMKYGFRRWSETTGKEAPIIVLYELDISTKTLTVIKRPTEYYFDNNDYSESFVNKYTKDGAMVDIDERGKYFIKQHRSVFGNPDPNLKMYTPNDRGKTSYYDTLEDLLNAINIFYPPSELSNIPNAILPLVARSIDTQVIMETTLFSLIFNNRSSVVIKGKSYILEAQTLVLSDYYNPPTNRTFYLYVRLNNGVASYHIENNIVNETLTNLLIGVVRTNGTGVYSIDLSNVTIVDDHRFSTIKMGNAIPVTLGSIREEGLIQIIKDPTDYV